MKFLGADTHGIYFCLVISVFAVNIGLFLNQFLGYSPQIVFFPLKAGMFSLSMFENVCPVTIIFFFPTIQS
jgi:hypothetical protein